MLTVDARGLSCPEPVMLMLDAIGKTTEPVVVLVDNATARGNVSHMAEERGRKVTITEEGGDFRLLLV
ncbi:MAG: sulfurtransferase TusA family protein [Butyricicoccus sp.]|nr:sulfurtransferase TusA family protein [Butyricicoccus sp.]